MPERITLQDSERITALLAARHYDGFLNVCQQLDLNPPEMVMLLAGLIKTMMPIVTGDEREDPLDMWVMEPTAPDAKPSHAMQLVVAYANDDDEMTRTHLQVLMNAGPMVVANAVVEMTKMASDLLRIYVDRETGATGE